MSTSGLTFFHAMLPTPFERFEDTKIWIKGPSVYEAMSLSLCDACMTSTFAYRKGLDLLMRIYFHLHPDVRPKGLNTASAQMKKLIDSTSSDKLIPQLAQVSYHLTVHGLKEHPTRYHEYALPPETTDWIAKSAAHVISDVLGLTIHLQEIASGKPLHASTLYQSEKDGLALRLKVRHAQYLAQVSSESMEYFNSYLLREPVPVQFDDAGVIAKLLPILEAENEVILKKFVETYTRLLAHVEAGELTKEYLLNMYEESVSSHRLHSTQAFFDSIHPHEEGHDVHLIHELIHALARLVALRDIDEQVLFRGLERSADMTDLTEFSSIFGG